MPTVHEILEFVETLAPRHMAEGWDRVGLNCGRLDTPVTKILVALDPFRQVCQEAKDLGAELLVTHHTLLFHPDFINDGNEQGRCALFLIENGIAHLNAHTNLDKAPGGINDCLAQALGLTDISVLNPEGTDAQGRPFGLVRTGEVAGQSLEAFLAHVKNALGCPALRYADGGAAVRRVAVGGGACADELAAVKAAGCDTFVTSDVKYNDFWDAQAMGVNLIDAGHFYTENPAMPVLAAKLQDAFPEVTVVFSAKHTDCMNFF